VLGETRSYSLVAITWAIRLIQGGARFIATNPDPTGPWPAGPQPATGSVAALVSKATGIGAYFVGKPNFLGDESEARVRDAYPGPTWDRLVEIKRRYDPTNLFRLNQNIPPATGSPGA
jgi:5'-nucleotidase